MNIRTMAALATFSLAWSTSTSAIGTQELNGRQMTVRQLEGRQIAPKELGGRQITPKELGGRQITPRQLDGRQMTVRQITPRQLDGRQITQERFDGRQVEQRQAEAGQPRRPRIVQAGPMLSDEERARIRQRNAAAQDAWVRERAKQIDPRGQGLNQAQIDAMEMQRRLMWNSTGPGMVYR